jgi:iron complex outermembrane receptor protein
MILRFVMYATRLILSASAILLLVTAASWTAHAQGEIVGSVLDENGDRLPGINVFIDGTGLGAATDLAGEYRIRSVPAGPHVLTASAIGYEQEQRVVEIQDGAEIRVDFVLEEMTIQGDEVVVTASRREQLSSRVAASVSSLGPQDIQNRNSVSLDEALQHVSGVQMAGNQVNIRGSSGFSYNTGSRVLLLVDGLPMLRPDADGIPFDALPMNQVERIEILKGPGSALYGGGALGGVVNVITKDFPQRPETSFDIYGGLYDPVRFDIWRAQWDGGDDLRPMGGVSAGHARRFGRGGGMWVSLSYRADAGHLRLDESRQLQAYTKVGFPLSSATRLSILTGVARRKSDVFLFWNGLRDALNPGQVDYGRTEPGTGSNDNLVNELSFLPSFTHITSPNFYYAVRGRLFGVLIQPLEDNGDPKPLSSGTVGFRYGGEVQLNYAPRDVRHITAGITGDANATRSSYYEDEDVSLSQPEGAVFVQWEETISDRLDIAAGARFDAYRIREGLVEKKLSPKLSASYVLTEGFVARAAYGEGFRVPSVAERFVSNSDYLPIVTNVDVRPEISRGYEVGLRASSFLIGWAISLDGALFWNDYRRLVEPTFIVQERAFQFVNLTRARVRGAEVGLNASAPRLPIRFTTGYTYLDARDLSADEPLVFRSKHLLKASGTLGLRMLHLGADLRLASRPERVDSDFALFVKDADRMVSTRVVDFRIGSEWRGVRATLHVKNAFDYYYLERPALLAPQRHFMLQVSTRF